ncbi:hypothetical protein PFLUV_G00202500 [Perca fluviatilis]|uniref:Uncharacterized protein n=1 Tax=Perca fluviatilis TaxID=8168 RepID=A0A6A5EP14_PERFL|nr:hypothetical protein PFLUV_G00202500 [Perca fluviatilis]
MRDCGGFDRRIQMVGLHSSLGSSSNGLFLFSDEAGEHLETLKRLNMEDFVKLKLTERQLLELIDTFADCAGIRGSKDYIALMVLPSLIPPAVFRMDRKTVRTTVSDAMKAFIDLKPVGANMVEYLQAAEQAIPLHPGVGRRGLLLTGIHRSQWAGPGARQRCPSCTCLCQMFLCV